MQKSAIMIVIAGALIVIGLILLAIGSQVILEGVSQENGIISSDQMLTVSAEFDAQETSTGVFAVQILEFKEGVFSARILNPFDVEIASQSVSEESTEEEFDVIETGTYKLVVQSTSNEEIQVFGAIGPLPDAGKKSLGFISVYVLVIGMAGLVAVGIYGIRNKIRSV